MYGSSRQYAEQYRQVGVTSAVADADPHKLVAMLLAGALALPSHDWETPMTVTGSLLLAATHLWNARHRHR